MKKKIKTKLPLNIEQLRLISGGGMCSTGAPSGTCPTGSNYCSGKTL